MCLYKFLINVWRIVFFYVNMTFGLAPKKPFKAVQKIKTVTWHLSWPHLALKKILNKTPQFSQAQNRTSTPNQPHQIAPGQGQ